MLRVFAGCAPRAPRWLSWSTGWPMPRSRSDGDYDALLEDYGHAQTAFEVAGGYTYETRIRQVLGGLGFNEDEHDKPLAHLSGGERTRALLAQLLLQEPDLLLLDEPTNHLDLEAVEWLEETLLHWQGALVVVAHDRYFLDKVATRIWDMDFGRVEAYRGNYTAYHQSARRCAASASAASGRRSRNSSRRPRSSSGATWPASAPRRPRGGAPGWSASCAMRRSSGRRSSRQIRLGLTTQIRSGDLVLATKDLVVGYDRPLFHCPNVEVRRGDRVALIGPNGAGKTTLLKTILGAGAAAGRQGALRRQRGGGLPGAGAGRAGPGAAVLDAILDVQNLPISQARNFLGQFLFRAMTCSGRSAR